MYYLDKLWKILFTVLCIFGFLWQEEEISKLYFAFEVTTSLEIDVPREVMSPDMSACYRFTDILNYDQLNKEHSVNYRYDMDEDELDILRQNLTIADIYKYTPTVNESFSSCRIRKPGSFKMWESNGTDCNKIFDVIKFFFNEYICYRYKYNLPKNMFSFDELAETPKYPGVIFEVTPGDKFNMYQSSKFIVHRHSSFPGKSSKLASVMDRGDDWQNDTINAQTFLISYFKLFKYRLPPPFETMCLNYQTAMHLHSQDACRFSCVSNKTETILKKVPFSAFTRKPVKLRFVSYLDTLDNTIRDKEVKIIHECNQKCNRVDCVDDLVFNRISYHQSLSLMIQVMVPIEPWVNVKYAQKMIITEYIFYMLACFGTWFGIAVLDFNFYEIMQKFILYRKRRQLANESQNSDIYERFKQYIIVKRMFDETNRKINTIFIRQYLIQAKYHKIFHPEKKIIGSYRTLNSILKLYDETRSERC